MKSRLPGCIVKTDSILPTNYNPVLAKIGINYRVCYSDTYRVISYGKSDLNNNGEMLFDEINTQNMCSPHERVFAIICRSPTYISLLFDNIRDLFVKVIKVDIMDFGRGKKTLIDVFWRYYYDIAMKMKKERRCCVCVAQNCIFIVYRGRKIYIQYSKNGADRAQAYPNTHLLYDVARIVAIEQKKYVDVLYALIHLLKFIEREQVVSLFVQKICTGVDTIHI